MKKLIVLLAALGVLSAWLYCADEESSRKEWHKSDGFVVHEWGVIAMKPNGNPAYTADYPDFVKETRSGHIEKNVKDLKPVVYFYSDKKRVFD